MQITPIGFIHSLRKNTYEAHRQAELDPTQERAIIELVPGQNFEQALIGLETFDRIWLVFQFHKNENWKPMVQPPRGSDKKVGVFASRAPHRPNPIGISCVKLISIEGLKLTIEGHDLIDQTPILDIKPYLNFSDAFPQASTGWLNLGDAYEILFTDKAQNQIDWLKKNGVPALESAIRTQLEFEPTQTKTKRIQKLSDKLFIYSYRTWRVDFEIREQKIRILEIRSGYSEAELNQSEDPHSDKLIHRQYFNTLMMS